ncbi:MAG: molybdenum cofactor guanylyltransferase [Labilibaculum antarcticum]
MIENKQIVGIVLSGGKSSRMGTEKGLVKWKGKSLIEYSVDCLRNTCKNIVVSSNKDCYNYLSLPVVADEIKDCGPIGGIYSCMKAVKADYYLVLACDVPNVPFQLFDDLLLNIGNADAIFPTDKGERGQPLISVYKASCFKVIEEELLKGNYKMMKLLDLLTTKTFSVTEELTYFNPKMLSNANSLDDINFL